MLEFPKVPGYREVRGVNTSPGETFRVLNEKGERLYGDAGAGRGGWPKVEALKRMLGA